jgi:hypothetical protein
MPKEKHRASDAELALLQAVARAAGAVAEAERGRDALIRQARREGAVWDDLAAAAGLAKDTVKRIVGQAASGSF